VNFSLNDLANTTDDLDARLATVETDLDDVSGSVDELADFEHHVCRWASYAATSSIGSNLYFIFANLQSPFCPRF
jgi:hypothetical protein